MLLKFRIKNFRSMNGMNELSMASGSTRALPDHIRQTAHTSILKNAIIYGANAAGKTVLIKGMEVARTMIIGDMNAIPGLRTMYCRTSEENRSLPTYFEFVIETGGQYYSYGFEILLSEGKYRSEWLIRLNPANNGEEVIFERDLESEEEFRFGDLFGKDENRRLSVYGSDLSGNYNTLFLSEMSRKNFGNSRNLNILKDVFTWFNSKLLINVIEAPSKKSITDAGKILDRLGTDVSDLKFRNAKEIDLRLYDPLYLSNIQITLRNNAMNNGPQFLIDPVNWVCFELRDNEVRMMKVYTKHKSSRSDFEIGEESTGTVQTLSLISLLTSDSRDVTYVLDEFGSAMHPLLATEFLRMFQAHNSDRENQLIVATHLVTLMTLELFRRDEIWFVDKKNGESEVYSLEEFKERFDKKLSKAYLEGRYGALPLIRDIEGD